MPLSSDWELCLTAGVGPALILTLSNRGPAERKILHSPNLQPSKLILRPGSGPGVELAAFDERTRRKFDRTVRRAMFTTLAPGTTLELGRELFAKVGETYQLRWGPFVYQEIPSGNCKVSAVFLSATTEATDGPVSGAWKGSLTSNEVIVSLP